MVLKRCVFFGDRVHQIRACGRQAKREKRNLCFRRKSDMWDEANTSSDDITTLQKFAYSIARSCVRLKRCYGVWIGVVFSSFKQTLLGAGEMVRASFPFWSLKQSVSSCLNCFCPRGLKLKKMSSLSAAVVLGLQSDDKATMLVVNTINNVLKNLLENGF